MSTIYGTRRNDVLDGTAGSDILFGYAQHHLSSGHDTLRGGGGDDFLYGDAGAAFEGRSDDVLEGGAGDDLLWTATGADRLDGGDGRDTAVIDREHATADLSFHLLDPATETTLAGDGTTAVGVETIHFFAGSGNDAITTAGGDDMLYGGAGDDRLRAGGGSDTLSGGDGRDTLDGGEGIDVAELNLWSTDADVLFVLRDAAERTFVRESGTTLLGIDAVFLQSGSGDDRLVGNDAGDWFSASGGRDALVGRDGADTLYGHAGDDVLNGGHGDDALSGDADDDRLVGGDGNDVLSDMESYSDGDDTLVGGGGDDVLWGGIGRDRFDGGTGDDLLICGHDGSGFVDDGSADVLVFRGAFGSDEVRGFQDGRDRLVFIGFEEDDVAVVRTEDAVSIAVNDGTDVHWVTLNSFEGTFDRSDYAIL